MNDNLASDFKIYLLYGEKTLHLHQNLQKNLILMVEKLSPSHINDAEVRLTGPEHVDILVKSREIHPNKRQNKLFFTISANELGLFTLTATLTSSTGHHITFPIQIRVEPLNYKYSPKEITNSQLTPELTVHAPSWRKYLIWVNIIFAIIGLILGIVGVNFLTNAFGDHPNAQTNLTSGLTLLIIGIIFGIIGTRGACCRDFICNNTSC